MESSSTSSSSSPDTVQCNEHQFEYSTNRILTHIPCMVCRDHSSGKHYGIYACDGCAGFFKRSVRRSRQYFCKSMTPGQCLVDKYHRNQCRACRLHKCFQVGMNQDAVQHERGPRYSTLQRQMELYHEIMDESQAHMPSEFLLNHPVWPAIPIQPVQPVPITPALDLSVPKTSHSSRGLMGPNMVLISAMTTPPLPPSPPLVGPQQIQEAAAGQLFQNVKWVNGYPTFRELPMTDQLLLLESSWKDLFILAFAQHEMPVNFNSLIYYYENKTVDRKLIPTVQREMEAFQSVLNYLAQLLVDGHEFNCLRAVVLFRRVVDEKGNISSPRSDSSDCSLPNARIKESNRINVLFDQAKTHLVNYVGRMCPNQPTRYQSLMQSIFYMKNISEMTIEEVFFRDTVGKLRISRLLVDLYRAGNVPTL